MKLPYSVYLIKLFIHVLAISISLVCNNRSRKNNKYLMLIVAALFPEIYLLQVGIRKYLLNDYTC